MKKFYLHLIILWLIFLAFSSFGQEEEKKVEYDLSARLNLENRYFLNPGLYEGQKRNYISPAFEPEFFMEWKDGRYSIKAKLFGRYDQHDENRTHADIRELYFQVVQNQHEFSVGMKKIFWGVTETAHIVNVINQTDLVESFDGEEKLGQPMVHYSYLNKIGTFDFFLMPYFRKPVFPGKNGRLRTPFLIEENTILFENDMEEFHPDLAFRWSHYFGKLDIGLSHFYGTSRQPLFSSFESFMPVFAIVNQSGLDLQATTGPVLWKFEGVYNSNSVIDYTALAAGLEYTFGNISGRGIDIGIVAEYLYDSRDRFALSSMQNDVFAGTRIAFNDAQDSQILAGAIQDLQQNSSLLSIEAGRRFGESWKVELEGRIFNTVSKNEFIYSLREDSFLKLAVNRYF